MRILLHAGSMRADRHTAVFGHPVQLHSDAEPARTRDSTGGRSAGSRVHSTRSDRLFAAVEVLPVRRVRPNVHRTGRRNTHYSAVSVNVSGGAYTYYRSIYNCNIVGFVLMRRQV